MANIMRLGGGAAASGGSDHVPVLGEDFTYTGSCEVIDDSDKVSGVQWRIKFLTSGTLVFAKQQTVDLFLVGGGGNGAAYGANNGAGGGGGGGYTGTFKQLTIEAQQSYAIVVGGSSGASSALGQSVNGGSSVPNGTTSGGSGGSGGGSGGAGSGSGQAAGGAGGSDGGNGTPTASSSGVGQGTTTREFGETGATLYSGGGGGGTRGGKVGYGGAGGGGNGNSGTIGVGVAGTANTGGGGGGGFGTNTRSAGGSGIAIIRKAKN